MDIQNRRAVRNTAAEALAAVPGDPKKTALIYAGSTAVVALVCSVINYVMSLQIQGAGGLGNLGLRSILSTVQTLMPLISGIFALFMSCGYQNAALRMARRQRCEPTVLLEGFRRFGPLARLLICRGMIYFSLAFVSIYAGAIIFVMTPLAGDFIEIMMPILNSTSMLTTEIVLDDATLVAATEAMFPAIPIALLVFLAIAAPIIYQYRMATFALLDNPGKGALAAMRESRAMMHGNRFSLFKLDLGFWWFYALEVLIGVVAYGDVLLPMVGVSFPWPDIVSYFLFYVISLAAQTGVYYLFLNQVHTTYATVYEGLKPEPQQETKVPLGNIFNM